MSIDVVVVNYRSAADVARCLAHLGAWSDGTVWLIDNSEQTQEAAALKALAARLPWVRLIVAPHNLGFGAACNLAYAASTAPLLLLLNPDALITRADVLELASALAADEQLGAVSPLTYWNRSRSFVLPPPTNEGPANAALPLLVARSAALARARASRLVVAERRHAAGSGTRILRALAGAVLLLRRAAVQAAGGLFDPRFFMFFEDADLSRRLRGVGYRLGLVLDATAVHEYRHQAAKAPLMERSCHAYFAKHHPRLYHWSGQLARLAVAPPLAAFERRCRMLGAFAGATEFNTCAGGGVLAFSPSPWLWPALLRAPGQAARGFDDEEWALLEPGTYAAQVAGAHGAGWVSFEKVRQTATWTPPACG